MIKGVDIDRNRVPSVWYFDANASVKIADAGQQRYELFVSVHNLSQGFAEHDAGGNLRCERAGI